MPVKLRPNMTLVFIGDSLTESDRQSDPETLGDGYVRLIRDMLFAQSPACVPTIINVGVSGDRIPDLHDRWETDVMAHKPDAVSIMIGINDVWKSLGGRDEGTSLEQFVQRYHVILRRMQMGAPECHRIVCEPTLIEPPQPDGMVALQPFVRAVRELSREFGTINVPLHSVFVEARRANRDIALTTDGVHLTSTGHMLIAQAWMRATGLLGASVRVEPAMVGS
jgi:lysophospholipase L1-like esterase